jgi:hypothetical protein
MDRRVMWVAQHPCGTWCAYRTKPQEKMGGWDGEVYAVLNVQQHLISWRQTLKCMPYSQYQNKYRHLEVK